MNPAHDHLRFEVLCQHIEPAVFAEPGVNFTVRPSHGSYELTLQKGADVASVLVDQHALSVASTPDELHGVAREALTRLSAAWRDSHATSLANPLDDYHTAVLSQRRPSKAQASDHNGDAPAVYPHDPSHTRPATPSSKYDDGQISAEDVGEYVSAERAVKDVHGNTPTAHASSKYDDNHKSDPKGGNRSLHPEGTSGGHDGTAAVEDVQSDAPAAKGGKKK